jgi:hypothetical protein
MKKLFLSIAAFIMAATVVNAQDEASSGVEFSVGADIVSSYVWRGAYQTPTAFQPSLGLTVGDFSLSSWASGDILGGGKEVDFTAAYSFSGLTLAVTDYWWAGERVYDYLKYSGDDNAHLFEATLSYTLPTESFPLTLAWNTFFAGADLKDENGDNYYSTYIEASLPFKVGDVDLAAIVGATPWKSIYSPDKGALTVVSLKAGKELKITDSFSLPVFGQLILNPKEEGIYFVFGVSL